MTQAQLSRLSELQIHPDEREASRLWRRLFGGLLLAAALGLAVLFALPRLGVTNSVLPSIGSLSSAQVTTTRVLLRKPSAQAASGALLTASGYVVARHRAAVSARGTGVLASLSVDIGDPVKKGQEIAHLEQDRERVRLQSAKARLAWAEANVAEERTELANAQKVMDRQKRLHQQGIATEQAMDDADARLSRSAARIRALEADLATMKTDVAAAEVELEYTIVRAPFDGTVLTRDAELGEIVAPVSIGGTSARGSIVSIADLADLEVEVDVSESYISRVRPDLTAQVVVDAYPDSTFSGRIRQIVPAANRQKASVQVKVSILDPAPGVLPEMGAKVTFLPAAEPQPQKPGEEARPVLVVDARAVRRNESGSFLLLVQDGKAVSRSVELGQQRGQEVELLRGAAEGDLVVLEGPAGLESGAPVQVAE